MATITFKGNPIHTSGELPGVGQTAPALRLTNAALADIGLDAFDGKKKILNIVPSLDTGVCQTSTRRFNEAVSGRGDTVLLSISADLPFAAKRFCETERLANVVTLSNFRSAGFSRDYGVQITDGPLAGLLSRAVLVLSADNRIVYTEQVPEIAQEPDYAAALKAVETA